MNFHAIGPLAFMNAITGEDYKYHMALAQYLYHDEIKPNDYFYFYKRRTEWPGYRVILDNGAYEGGQVSYRKLLQATLELDPHIVILPDVPHNMGATLEGGEAFKSLLKKNKWGGRTMTVVHAEPGNFDQFCHSYAEACKQSPWVGISRLTEDFGKMDGGGVLGNFDGKGPMRRSGFLLALSQAGLLRKSNFHHALGMRDGSLEELSYLASSGLFESCDSSAPICRGLDGWALEEGESHPTHPDFDPTFVNARFGFTQAKANFNTVLAICKGELKYASGSWNSIAVQRP